MTPALVHLVRYANGPGPFERFMESYRAHEPGIEHELVLVFKGFPNSSELGAFRQRVATPNARELELPDAGVDLTAYLAAARLLDHPRVCFVNSFSEVRADGWLELLNRALAAPSVGIAGATGSWASHRAGALLMLGLAAGLGADFDRSATLRALSGLGSENQPRARARPLSAIRDLSRGLLLYPSFPAPHVRTNAFMIERELLLSVAPEGILDKQAAYQLEAGKDSLTTRIQARGLRAVIVGRDEIARPSQDWPEADLLWQADQADLLVADNQTAMYDSGTSAQRSALSRMAWGVRARPAPGHADGGPPR